MEKSKISVMTMCIRASTVIDPFEGEEKEGLVLTACACANCSPDSGESAYVWILSVNYINLSYSNMRCPCYADRRSDTNLPGLYN